MERRAPRCPSPNFDARPAGLPISLVVLHSISLPPGEYGGDAIEQLFTNRLDWDAHPYYDGIRGLRVSAHFLVRRDGALLQFVSCDAARLACRPLGVARPRGLQRLFDRHRARRAWKGDAFEPAQYSTAGRLLRALARATRSTRRWATRTWRRGARPIPGAGFDWPRLRKQLRRRRPALPRATLAIGEGPKTQHYR